MADAKKIQDLGLLADRLRIHSIKSTNASKSGHPTSCSSMADVLSVLFFHEMRYSLENPRDPGSDRFILSKGHAAPILYAAWAEAGLFPTSELLKLREIDNDLEGHPTPRLNFVDVATGSLGQGLSVAAGMAYIGKNLDNAAYRTYCLLGDGESAEGSVWEALHFAGHYKLNNLCAIFDINRLGQSEATALQHDMETYRKRLDAFGWNAIVIDGHDIEEIVKAFEEAHNNTDKPTAILARTFKGYKFPTISDSENWHGKPLGDKSDEVIKALLAGMDGNDDVTVSIAAPPGEAVKVDLSNITLASPPSYKLGELVATRLSYGTALTKLAKSHPRVIALDGDTKNSTYSDKIKTVDANRYIECYIAEQNLVGVAMGAACRDRTVAFVSTFAAFFTRAFDQLRMGAISQTNINCVGSHAGVSIGEDGPSQMALEDLAMFRSIPTATVFYPSDAVSCERAVELAANKKGICFIRTSRPNTAVIYANDEDFQIGQGKVVLQHDNDVMVIVGAGVTLHEALAAAQTLEKEHGILVAVVDPFTIKPIDEQLLIAQAKRVGGRVLTVEDHYPEGGLGEAVTSALSMEPNALVKRMAVREVPRSGPPQALLEKYNIDRNAIVKEVRGWLGN